VQAPPELVEVPRELVPQVSSTSHPLFVFLASEAQKRGATLAITMDGLCILGCDGDASARVGRMLSGHLARRLQLHRKQVVARESARPQGLEVQPAGPVQIDDTTTQQNPHSRSGRAAESKSTPSTTATSSGGGGGGGSSSGDGGAGASRGNSASDADGKGVYRRDYTAPADLARFMLGRKRARLRQVAANFEVLIRAAGAEEGSKSAPLRVTITGTDAEVVKAAWRALEMVSVTVSVSPGLGGDLPLSADVLNSIREDTKCALLSLEDSPAAVRVIGTRAAIRSARQQLRRWQVADRGHQGGGGFDADAAPPGKAEPTHKGRSGRSRGGGGGPTAAAEEEGDGTQDGPSRRGAKGKNRRQPRAGASEEPPNDRAAGSSKVHPSKEVTGAGNQPTTSRRRRRQQEQQATVPARPEHKPENNSKGAAEPPARAQAPQQQRGGGGGVTPASEGPTPRRRRRQQQQEQEAAAAPKTGARGGNRTSVGATPDRARTQGGNRRGARPSHRPKNDAATNGSATEEAK